MGREGAVGGAAHRFKKYLLFRLWYQKVEGLTIDGSARIFF